MHPAPVDRMVQRRPYRRTGRRSIAVAILLHLLAIGGLVLLVRSKPLPNSDASPAEVALLFEGGLRRSSSTPPSEHPSQAPVASPTPGTDTENTRATSPPPGEAAAPAPPEPAAPIVPSPAPAATPSPPDLGPASAVQRTETPPTPTVTPTIPDVTGTAPPVALAGREPPPPIAAQSEPARPAAVQSQARFQPERPISRSFTRPPLRPQQRTLSNGFPTTLFASNDLGSPSVARHASNAAPPRQAIRSSMMSDFHGAEDLGADWANELQAYVRQHNRYPEEAIANDEEGDVTVQFTVPRNGHVANGGVDLVEPSRSTWLDSEFLSVFRGARLPPFPPGAPDDSVTITYTMHYVLIR